MLDHCPGCNVICDNEKPDFCLNKAYCCVCCVSNDMPRHDCMLFTIEWGDNIINVKTGEIKRMNFIQRVKHRKRMKVAVA